MHVGVWMGVGVVCGYELRGTYCVDNINIDIDILLGFERIQDI